MIDVLMFHRVLPKKQINYHDAYFIRGTLISSERLEEIILSYTQKGFLFKTVKSIDNNSKENQVVLTFDDGYLDNYLYVNPILDKYNIKGTFFPIIGYCKEQTIAPLDVYYNYVNKYIQKIEKQNWIKGDKKKEFLNRTIKEQINFVKQLNIHNSDNQLSYMNTDMLRLLYNLGHEIGGHSYYHDIYTKISKKDVLKDIQTTKQTFSNLGIEIISYAFTDGQYNLSSVELLKQEGIKYACVIKANDTVNVENNNYEIERKFVREYDIIY